MADAFIMIEPLSLASAVRSRFSDVAHVGQGAYGIVFSALDSDLHARRVAVKRIKNVFECPLTAKRILREIRVHRLLQREAPEVAVQLLDAVVPSDVFNDVFLVMELMDCTLNSVCNISDGTLTDTHVQYLAQQLLKVIRDMHACGIVHRDIKPQNILVNADCTLKLCDFGMARMDSSGGDRFMWSDYVTTRWYRAPEMLSRAGRHEYTKASDMWSAGCVIAELLTGGKAMFPGRSVAHQISLIEKVMGPMDAAATGYNDLLEYRLACAPPGAVSLLRGILKYDPKERMTADQALSHDFFAAALPPSSSASTSSVSTKTTPLPQVVTTLPQVVPTPPPVVTTHMPVVPTPPPVVTTPPPVMVTASSGGEFNFDLMFLSNREMRELLRAELADLHQGKATAKLSV